MERVDHHTQVERLHAVLAAASGNPFLHPAWVLAHARRLETDADRSTWLVHGEAGPIGLAVLCHRPDGTVRFAADRLSDVTGAAGRPEDRGAVLAALTAAFDEIVPRGGRFLAGPLPISEVGSFPGWDRGATDRSPTVVVVGLSWAQYLDGPGARRRRRIAVRVGSPPRWRRSRGGDRLRAR